MEAKRLIYVIEHFSIVIELYDISSMFIFIQTASRASPCSHGLAPSRAPDTAEVGWIRSWIVDVRNLGDQVSQLGMKTIAKSKENKAKQIRSMQYKQETSRSMGMEKIRGLVTINLIVDL